MDKTRRAELRSSIEAVYDTAVSYAADAEIEMNERYDALDEASAEIENARAALDAAKARYEDALGPWQEALEAFETADAVVSRLKRLYTSLGGDPKDL